ncbi:glycosyltransferase family 2 protein [Microbacterium paludicola]|uniref:glycosyltransferase family 2 protein n=1 Tax=Microbacterium paludicola TaxID=300019 RepID=UPI0011A2F171|nr:glycosyltransferase family 2 protein [Microbacterium paludicola]
MTAQPRVSVVIPCHDYGRFLDDAVSSALDQEGVDVDVTIVDDASTDDSVARAEAWAARDRRVSVVAHRRNRGHIRTFNEALVHATAPYVVKLDADDLLAAGSLRRSTDLLEAHPGVVLVSGEVEHFAGDAPSGLSDRVRSWRIQEGRQWIEGRMRRPRNPLSQPEIMMRRSALEQVGGHRGEVPASSDFHLWLRMAAVGDVARINGAVQGLYRVHGANMQATMHAGLLRDLQARRDAIELFLAEEGAALPDAARLREIARTALARDAVRAAFQELEAGRDPQTLVDEAQDLDPDIVRTLNWKLLERQRRVGERADGWIAAGHLQRDLAARVRWRMWRRYGI